MFTVVAALPLRGGPRDRIDRRPSTPRFNGGWRKIQAERGCPPRPRAGLVSQFDLIGAAYFPWIVALPAIPSVVPWPFDRPRGCVDLAALARGWRSSPSVWAAYWTMTRSLVSATTPISWVMSTSLRLSHSHHRHRHQSDRRRSARRARSEDATGLRAPPTPPTALACSIANKILTPVMERRAISRHTCGSITTRLES